MTLFDVLYLIGGLALFLFGMTLMGQALERRAGSGLKTLIGRLTARKGTGLLTGLGVTAVIQSSSATTVMVVGFVNSGLMTLRQSIPVIMGANIGTTVTAWILSLAGISGDNFFVEMLQPTSWTPILAVIGLLFYMAGKGKKKDTGLILLGFAVLMYGMDSMSASVAGLQNVPQFREMFLAFQNPILGIAVGAILTGIIQSSSASVGILQALASTGAVSYGAAIPIIMGQNIGTCVTALISSIGTNKNARRAALVHLSFNVFGSAVWITVFCIVRAIASPAILNESATMAGIAVCHSLFNIACTCLMFPFTNLLEKWVYFLLPETNKPDEETELDVRLLASPGLAISRCRELLDKMAKIAVGSLKKSLDVIKEYDEEAAREIREAEDETDHIEDILGSYLVKLTSTNLNPEQGEQATEYMKLIGDYERIGDHAVNILESAEEMKDKGIKFSAYAEEEYYIIASAINEILDLSYQAFKGNNLEAARKTEPLEQVIDNLKETLRTRHILRVQKGECSIEAGFIWTDLLTNLERVSDHCSNISGCIIDTAEHNMDTHKNMKDIRESDEDFKIAYGIFSSRYSV
jgi:phosphate:Na+ symporter